MVRTLVDNRKAALTFALLVIYVALLGPVGFVPMSAAFIFALALVFYSERGRLFRRLNPPGRQTA